MKWLLLLTIVALLAALCGGSVAAAQPNLVNNGDFEGGFVLVANPDPLDALSTPDQIPNGWTGYETFTGGIQEISTLFQWFDNGPSLPGTSSLLCGRGEPVLSQSGDWTAVYQDLNIDASECSNLTLSMDVKVTNHNLPAGGWVTPAFEWPVLVQINYTTTSGGTQVWRHGWYIDPPGDDAGSPINDPGTGLIPVFNDELVTQGVWDSNSFNLSAVLPQLDTITRIYVGGAGWNFEGQVDNVVIECSGVSAVPGVTGWGGLVLLVLLGILLVYLARRRKTEPGA